MLDTLFSLPEYQATRRISVFLSMPFGEISTGTIVRDAFHRQKKVFVPYIHRMSTGAEGQSTPIMDMLSLHSIEDYESLKPDGWGIPSLDTETVSHRENYLDRRSDGDLGLDMVVMPGLAFDTGLGRLGHGKGYYDRFLHRYHEGAASKNPTGAKMPFLGTQASSSIHHVKADFSTLKVALALKEQILPRGQNVPTDQTDWPVDALIAGDGTLLCATSRVEDEGS